MYTINKYDSGVHVHAFDCRYTKCDSFIRDLEEGKLQTQPGCSEEETLEVKKNSTRTACTILMNERKLYHNPSVI